VTRKFGKANALGFDSVQSHAYPVGIETDFSEDASFGYHLYFDAIVFLYL